MHALSIFEKCQRNDFRRRNAERCYNNENNRYFSVGALYFAYALSAAIDLLLLYMYKKRRLPVTLIQTNTCILYNQCTPVYGALKFNGNNNETTHTHTNQTIRIYIRRKV